MQKLHIADPADKEKVGDAIDAVASAVHGLIVDPSQRAITVTVGQDTLGVGLVLEIHPHVVHPTVVAPDRRIVTR